MSSLYLALGRCFHPKNGPSRLWLIMRAIITGYQLGRTSPWGHCNWWQMYREYLSHTFSYSKCKNIAACWTTLLICPKFLHDVFGCFGCTNINYPNSVGDVMWCIYIYTFAEIHCNTFLVLLVISLMISQWNGWFSPRIFFGRGVTGHGRKLVLCGGQARSQGPDG